MNNAMKRYYAINQLMVNGKLPENLDLPELNSEVREKITEKLSGLEKQHLDEIETLFVRLLHIPDYHLFNVNGKVLSLTSIIGMVRSGEFQADEVAMWAQATLVDIKTTVRSETKIVDGVLYLSEKYYDQDYDLEGAMLKAFHLRCWGRENDDANCRELVHYAEQFSNPQGYILLGKSGLTDFVDACVAANIHPYDLGHYALSVPDLSVTLAQFGCLASWGDNQKKCISLVVPRGTVNSASVAQAKVSIDNFMAMHAGDGGDLRNLVAKGDRLVVAGGKSTGGNNSELSAEELDEIGEELVAEQNAT